jgi:hypothetical protein
MTFGEVIWRIDAVHSIQQSQVNCLQCLSPGGAFNAHP